MSARPHFPWFTVVVTLISISIATTLGLPAAPIRLPHPPPGELAETLPLTARYVATLVVHQNLPHLVGNLAFLGIFGTALERRTGTSFVILVFLTGGVAAHYAGDTLARYPVSLIGMSSAVSAILGAFAVLFPKARIGLFLPLGFYFEFVRIPAIVITIAWFFLQLFFTVFDPGSTTVAWWAHVTGFLSGALLAVILRVFRGTIRR